MRTLSNACPRRSPAASPPRAPRRACRLAAALAALATLAFASHARAELPHDGPSWDLNRGPLRVSPDGHHLVHTDGSPFFYLGDTAWQLFMALNKTDALRYLDNRRAKGFTVIQSVALAEFGGWYTPNQEGNSSFLNGDVNQPNPAYFDHVEWVIDRCAERGMMMGLLPAWNTSCVSFFGSNTSAAENYGYYLANRFKSKSNIIWILGGDRDPSWDARLTPLIRAIARGVARGLNNGSENYGNSLMTFHPASNSANYYHDEIWLDFNSQQSGHVKTGNWGAQFANYTKVPAKPTIDMEPSYEDHPVQFNYVCCGWFDEVDVRNKAYWAVFAGAFGHTYGCHPVWYFFKTINLQTGMWPTSNRKTWDQGLDLPGAWDMLNFRRLLVSRPLLVRAPDQSVITSSQGNESNRRQAARATDGSYAMVYLTDGGSVSVNLDRLSGSAVNAWWFNPRDGSASLIGTFPKSGARTFQAASSGRGNDWVLVLDDAARGWGAPGSGSNPGGTTGSGTTGSGTTSGGTTGNQAPYGGAPAAVPGRIQAEAYDEGGSGVAYGDSDAPNNGGQFRTDSVDIEATTDAGGGANVGWTEAGEWLEYTVQVAAAGTYDLRFRVARQPAGSGSARLRVGGTDVTGTLIIPSTGGWQTWTTVTRNAVALNAGEQVLRFEVIQGQFNLNWIEIVASATGTTAGSTTSGTTSAGTTTSGATSAGSTTSGTTAGGSSTGGSSTGSSETTVAVLYDGETGGKPLSSGQFWAYPTDRAGGHGVTVSEQAGGAHSGAVRLQLDGAWNYAVSGAYGYSFGWNFASWDANRVVAAAPATDVLNVWLRANRAYPASGLRLGFRDIAGNLTSEITPAATEISGDLDGTWKLLRVPLSRFTAPANFAWANLAELDVTVIATPWGQNGQLTVSLDDVVLTRPGATTPGLSWTSQDIGAVGLAGRFEQSGGTVTLEGSGADIWGTADAFRFAQVSGGIDGDGEIVAHVVSVENTDGWAKAGVMIRAGTGAGASFAMAAVTPLNGVAFQRRPTANGTAEHTGATGAAPQWLRLVRVGNTLTAYRSADGASWSQVGSATVTMPTVAEIGLCVTAHNNATLCTAVFSDVSVTR